MKKLYKCLCTLLGLLSAQEMANGANEIKASWRTTSHSSQWEALVPEFAVDGDRSKCSHTNMQTDPWWRLELWHEYQVNTVTITNLDSTYYDRINGAVIRVGNFPDIYSNPICAVISTVPAGQTTNFSCGGMEGRYVFVHIPGDGKILVLCEVQVYGYLTGPVLKRSIVKMMLNSRADLTEQTMRENILEQLDSALADRGFTNVTVSWFQSPEQVIHQKVNTTKSCAKVP